MSLVFPFQAYRYTQKAGPLNDLVTQPYDKISSAMRARYLSLNRHNLVRVILGETSSADTPENNVYTRAATHLEDWIATGVLARDADPALFAYFQEFADPDTGQTVVRKGFIGLGPVEDYSAGVVFRHEQTLSGPKKDRLELLRHTRAHFGQLFMLYPDASGEVDAELDQAARTDPTATVLDEYETRHTLWRISKPERIARIQALMAPRKLLIADGHHRYETALAFRDENPNLAGARRVMMTFVNMHSSGLKILATHRLVSNLDNFDAASFLKRTASAFTVERIESAEELRHRWAHGDASVIGAAMRSILHALTARDRGDGLDVRILHDQLLAGVLGINEEAVRGEKHLRYIRGMDAALAEARSGGAQIAFLLKPTSIEQVASISFSGGVMPQKSTDFYPKMLSGLTIYRIES